MKRQSDKKIKTVSVLIITRNRTDELFETIDNVLEQTWPDVELIVAENGSDEEILQANGERMKAYNSVQYHVFEENLGVAGGRNELLKRATGDCIIEIDDDAVFEREDGIERAVDYLHDHRGVGVLAFHIINFHSRTITPTEYPFRDKRRNPRQNGPCAWFIGAGHAIRREVLDEIGLYREFFPWGSEEQDFSLRVLDAGWDLHYAGDIIVYHKKSPKARLPEMEFAGVALKNRIKIALLNLPWYSVATYTFVRGAQFCLRHRSLEPLTRAFGHLRREWDYIRQHRRVIRSETIRTLIRRRGQLLF